VVGGVQYYVVIDGYGGDAGDYMINIDEYTPCMLECPAGATLENEPPLAVDYEDTHNGGCNHDIVNPPFGTINSQLFCGVSGFYLYQGSSYRDTDWFEIVIPEGGVLEITGDAELGTYMFELGPQDCDTAGVLQNVQIGPCTEGTITITGAAGSTVWFWVGPTTFDSPDGSDVYEYDYVLVTNIQGGVATEDHSWTGVKSLFE
jgi:hypothetical protein